MIARIRQASLGPERLKDESTRAYKAFGVYCKLGQDRSLDKAWKRFRADQGKDPASARRPGHWAEWSQKFRWVERAEAHDDLIDEERRNADAEVRQQLHQMRANFAVEEQGRKEDLVRVMDKVLIGEYTSSRAEITQVKADQAACTETTTKKKPPTFQALAALTDMRTKLANQAIQGVDSKDPATEERKIDRLFWIPAKDRSADSQGELGTDQLSRPSITDLDFSPTPFEEDKAA